MVGLLLRAYPSTFRAAYGREVAGCVRDARQALGEAAPLNALGFWAAVFLDLARQAVVERLAVAASGAAAVAAAARGHGRRPAGALLLLAAIGNTAYEVASVRNSMGILAAALTAVSAAAGVALSSHIPISRSRRSPPRRRRTPPD